jgi:AraC-like DNA-binding protein
VRNPGAHIHLTAEGPARLLFVRIDANAVSARALRLLRRPLREEIQFALHLDITGEGRSLWNTLLWICRELDSPGNLFRRSITLAHEAETLLIDALLTVQASNYSEDLRAVSSVAVPRHLRTVLSAIDAAPQSTWSLSEMARTGGVSVRTLCDAFRHFRGCTPMEFVRSVRLARARDDLRRPGQGVSIADVARRWGFGHPGRFAATYRGTYGQTPSETLRFGVGQDAD